MQDKVRRQGIRHIGRQSIQRFKTEEQDRGASHSDRHRTCVTKVQDIEREVDNLMLQANESDNRKVHVPNIEGARQVRVHVS